MSKRYSICIGVNKHKFANHINLRFARSDAESVASILSDPLRGNCDEVYKLLDEDATKATIRSTIDNLLQNPLRQPDDLVVLFFSGHGTRDKQGDLCLVPTDAQFHTNGEIDYSSLYHAKELEISIANSKVENIIILIDCCHSGALGKILNDNLLSDSANLFVIGAARASEYALEIEAIQHGVFTECLLRSFNLQPEKGEWISLGQITNFVCDEIQNFESTQLIQNTSRFVDPNLGVTRNPNFSIDSKRFTQEIARIFELANYEIQTPTPPFDYPNFFIAKVQTGFRPIRTGVLCLDNRRVNITYSHIEQFISFINRLHADQEIADGMLITYKDLSPKIVAKVNSMAITSFSTGSDLLRSLIDFSRYVRRLINEFSLDNLDRPGEPAPIKYYVELEAEADDPKFHDLAIKYIEKWISKSNVDHLVLLGEYGSGKTTLSKKIAFDFAKNYNKKNKKSKRIPILIHLREFPRGQADIEAFVTGYLARKCEVNNPSFEAFKAMNDAGFLLLILDGFDEMVLHADEETIQSNIAQIEQLAISPKSKILLTSRPEYFISSHEERRVLQASNLLSNQREFTILHLRGFEEKQIKQYLQKRIPTIPNVTKDWSYYFDEIKVIHDLSDLSSRPVLLEMIVKTLPNLLAKGDEIDRPLLYQAYLEGELRRQSVEKRRSLLLKLKDRLKMMQTLATHFYFEKPPGLSAELVQLLVQDQISPEQRDELEAHIRDFLACSFLVRHGDKFAFSHWSFVEYLTAKSLLEEIENSNPTYFPKEKLTNEIIDFLREMNPNRLVLRDWIQATRYRDFKSIRYLASNSISLLVKLEENLSDLNFAGAVLNQANLSGGIFNNTVFAQTDLSEVNLSEAKVNRCNFTGALFAKTKFLRSQAKECDFREAIFDLTDLSDTDISGSDLSGCLFYEVNFQDVLADNCKLRSLEGILNPSPSVKLACVDISGNWTKEESFDYGSQLWIDSQNGNEISGKLKISEHNWIEIQGVIKNARYELEGKEFHKERFVITQKFLGDVMNFKLPHIVVEALNSWENQAFKSQIQFFERIDSELSSARIRRWLTKTRNELQRREQQIEEMKKELQQRAQQRAQQREQQSVQQKEKKRKNGKRQISEFSVKELESQIKDLEEELIKLKKDFSKRERMILEANLDFNDEWFDRLKNIMGSHALALDGHEFEVEQYQGWLSITSGDENKLLLFISPVSRKNVPENPVKFVRRR